MAEKLEITGKDEEEKKKKDNITWLSLPKNKKELLSYNLKGFLHPALKMAYKSIKIKRSPRQAFIFLVGESGCGKSSTVNYLFKDKIAKVNKSTSEQRQTTEYMVSMASEEWKIPDLTLSVVDTPGFGDTDGFEQDVKNMASIVAFRKHHPNLKDYFPNLVFLVMKITENRMEGSSSNFSKLLRTLNVLDIIDKKNHNIVVVLTHAAMLPPNQKIFEDKVAEMKNIVTKMFEALLEITPLIVIQENQPEEYGLVEEGDWHILPNKERQPLALFTACKTILNQSQDELCHEAISVYFRSADRSKPTELLSCDSSSLKASKLQKIHGAMLEPIFPSNDSEVSNLLDGYIKEHPQPGLVLEVDKLKMRFNSMGITSAKQLQSISMNQLKIRLKATYISPSMEKILEDTFGMNYEQMCGLDCGIGRGFNVFTDNITLKSPYVLDDCETGKFGLPQIVKVKHCNYFEINCQEVEDQNQYVTSRLKSLRIEGGSNINFSKFSLPVRGGFNIGQNENSKDDISFSIEQRLYKITLPDSIGYTGEFKADITNLPQKYEETDESNVEKWKLFFSKWGYFIVLGMYLGGSVSGCIQNKVDSENGVKKNCDDAQAKLSAKLLSFQRKGLLDIDRETFSDSISSDKTTFTSSSLQWVGGDKSPKTSSFENIQQGDWENWLESLEYKPAPLSTSLDLYPIYLLIDEIDKEKCIAAKRAMEKEMFRDVSNQSIESPSLCRSTAAPSNSSDGCFDGSSSMFLTNGKMIKMEDIAIGDKVLSVDNHGKLVQDSVIAWLHKVPEGSYRFLELQHSFGSLIITPEHILYLGVDRIPVFAYTVKTNDYVTVISKFHNVPSVVLSKVISVEEVKMKGLFAPLTLTGNLIVDGVAVSCYCKLKPLKLFGREIISSQSLAHLAFFPLRTAYMLGMDVNEQKTDKSTGIHRYAKVLMNLTKMG